MCFRQFTFYSVVNFVIMSISCYLSGEMGPDFSLKTPVKSLTSQQLVRINQLFRQAKFDDPSGDVRNSPLIKITLY